MPPTTERPWLTPQQVAALFGASIETIRKWADEGKIPSFRTPGGQRRFMRSQIDAVKNELGYPDLCHRCEQRPATDDGVLCDECRAAEAEAVGA